MKGHGTICWRSHALSVLSAVGAALLVSGGPAGAQDGMAVPEPGREGAEPSGGPVSDPQCIPPQNADEAAATVDGPAYVMPTTGAAFTLPPEETEIAALPECPPPPPVRPAAPDAFGFSAVPLGEALRGDWDAAKAIALQGRSGQWEEMLSQTAALQGRQRLDRVNRWVNWHVRYADDRQGDRWSDAAETLRAGQGDCEDFAITKMALLAELGVSPDDMFLVLLRDRQQGDHAVLAVRDAGELLVLDNRTDVLRRADEIEEYVPTLSYSGPFAWTYGRPAAERERTWGSPLSRAAR